MYPASTQTASSTRGGNGSALGPIPTNAVERATVQSHLGEQERILSELHGSINELESRLSIVLGPVPPNVEAAGKPPTPSSVMACVEQHNRLMIGAIARLRELMNRLEL